MKELNSDERERRLRVIIEGKNSDYWILLKETLQEWLQSEMGYLDSFKSKGLSDGDVEDYNRSRDKVEMIRKFLRINEDIIVYNRSILDRVKRHAEFVYNRIESFVKG